MKTLAALVVAACLAAPPAAAQVDSEQGARVKLRVFVGAGLPLGSIDYTESRSFPLYDENGSFEARYSAEPGSAVSGGLEFRFARRLGVQLAVSNVSRDAEVAFSGRLPHPFFFGQHRELSGSVASLDYSETAAHFDLVFVATSGPRIDASLFAGVSMVKVEAQLLGELEFEQSYPFDDVALGATPKHSLDDTPMGFNVGASLDYRFSERFGVGAQLRYTRASASFEPVAGSVVEVDAGGAVATLGIRLFF